ncbi:MAG: hypothetical protein Fur0010_14410 [Bdellovibrio sp.]
MTSLVLMSIFFGVFSFWFFGSPGEATSVEAFKKWDAERNLMLEKQKLMTVEILSENFKYQDLELIYIGPGKPYFSWWGHLLLRFVGSGTSPEMDFALGFVADFNDFPLDKYKGLFGGYTVLPKIDTIKNFHHEYAEVSAREFVRYQLKSTQLQRDKLLGNLKEWLRDPSLPGSYSFAQNNCVGLMAKLMVQSNFEQLQDYGYFPKTFILDLQNKGLVSAANMELINVRSY